MKTRNIFKSLLLCGTMLMAVGCANDYEFNEYYRPTDAAPAQGITVTTGDVQGYGVLAKAEMTLSVPEGTAVEQAGFIYGTEADLNIASDNVTRQAVKGLENGGTSAIALNDLKPGVTYYVQAYAYIGGNLLRGETKQVVGSNDFERQLTKEYNLDESEVSVVRFSPVCGPRLRDIGLLFDEENLPAIDFTIFNDDFNAFEMPVVEGVANLKVDLTGKDFAAIHINALNIGAALVEDYTIGSSYAVYLADALVTSPEELQKAQLLGSYNFGQQNKFEEESQFDIPFGVTGEKFIVIYSASLYSTGYSKYLSEFARANNTPVNYGLSITNVGVSELVKAEK